MKNHSGTRRNYLIPRYVLRCIMMAWALSTSLRAHAVTLEQIISRENPRLHVAEARMAIGRDGLVYLSNLDPASMGPGWMLRLSRDGKVLLSGDPGPAPMFVTANRQGVIGTANAHFTHAAILRDANLQILATNNNFVAEPGYQQPTHIEAGESGDFYALDRNKKQILRIDATGKTVATILCDPAPAEFRVHEKTNSLYLFTNDWTPLRKIGMDGKVLWEAKVAASGGFDVDATGVLYALATTGERIQKYSVDGQPLGEIALQLREIKTTLAQHPFINLRLWENEIFLKRRHPTELFLKFDLTSGALKQTFTARHEKLAVSYPDEVWTAGSSLPFSIQFTDSVLGAKPQWRVWARSLGALNWHELAVSNGTLAVPENYGGLYQIKVTPEVLALQRGAESEYIVQSWVEVRRPNSQGTLNVWTPQNRTFYGRGEPIPFTILRRGKVSDQGRVLLRLIEEGTERVLAEASLDMASNQPLQQMLPAALTAGLLPREYRIEASAPGWTPVAQYLSIGSGLDATPFLTIRYADYGGEHNAVWPIGATVWNASDLASSNAERLQTLGINMVGERLTWNASQIEVVADAALRKRLESDPVAAAPEKTALAHPFLQSLAALGASGTRHTAVLLGNDAGLPIGTGYGPVPQETLLKTLRGVSGALQSYPAFRGWSWGANWFLFNHRGADAARSPEEKAAYQAAVKRAYETGEWDPIIDTVAAIRWDMAPEATAIFNKALHEVSPDLRSAFSSPYRSGETYPPRTFENVDEVQLQAQWEQIAPPYYPAHNAEYYKRPGKPAWGHPEVWNDPGTGEQIVPTWFQMAMRGATGVGFANHLLHWQAEDARSSATGSFSTVRATNNLLRQYGPWLTTLQSDDRVAIPVSSRMLKLDSWDLHHFWSVFEAFYSCLHAHHPASIVFAEDLKPGWHKEYSAIILAGHKVAMEPALQNAIQRAQGDGVKVFYDNTSRAELFKQYTPLGIAFDKVGQDHSMGVGGDESGYPRLPKYMQQNLPALRKALDGTVPQVARADNDEVWLTQQKSGNGRFLWVVNNSTPAMDPDHLWRMTLYSGTRVPVQTRIELIKPAAAIYDLFAMKQVTPQANAFTADLRNLPGRVYAMLPVAIGSVALRGPSTLNAGQTFAWWAQVRDASNKPIASTVPLRVRLLAIDGSVLQERFISAPESGVRGEFAAPLNAHAGAQVLEATELFSGKSTRLAINVPALAAPAALNKQAAVQPAVTANASGQPSSVSVRAAVADFGPHLRDMILVDDGRVAVLNAMNWDDNVYGVDTASGKVLWSRKFGQYFTFAPQALRGGFAVQGFDFTAPEGYHLYLADGAGNAQRRFAHYGLPLRAPFRMYPQSLHSRDNNFTAAPDGSWLASSGGLGLAVWSRDGKLLWSQDDWKQTARESRANPHATWSSTRVRAPLLLALNNDLLLVVDDEAVTARRALSGQQAWKTTLPLAGEVRRVRASADGKTVALLSTIEGGNILMLRDGQVAQTFPSQETYDFEMAPDGSTLAVLTHNQLKLYDTSNGLRWIFPADDLVRFARFGSDGRIALTDDLGTVYVLNRNGTVLHKRDTRALAVPQWLANGDLLLASWSGRVLRLNEKYSEVWNAHLQPSRTEKRDTLLARDTTPTTRVAGWGNEEKEPWPAKPNLLSQPGVTLSFPRTGHYYGNKNDWRPLLDGDPAPPAQPWFYPGDLNQWAGLQFFNPITMNFKTPVRATAVTFFEDAQHPNSWLRDLDIEYFDSARNEWVHLQRLLSNSAVHTHKFAQPVASTQFRILLPMGLYGNMRLGEIVLHGETTP